MIGQIVSLIGAAMILAAFGAQQAGRLRPEERAYLLLNLVGSAILTYFAVQARNLGLIVLEGSWALISLASLVRSWIRVARS
jgi:predicted regulator of Ras-like GTPase activity (Roadblock/LC7/MglB family)